MFPKQHLTVVLRTLICEVGPVDKSLKNHSHAHYSVLRSNLEVQLPVVATYLFVDQFLQCNHLQRLRLN